MAKPREWPRWRMALDALWAIVSRSSLPVVSRRSTPLEAPGEPERTWPGNVRHLRGAHATLERAASFEPVQVVVIYVHRTEKGDAVGTLWSGGITEERFAFMVRVLQRDWDAWL